MNQKGCKMPEWIDVKKEKPALGRTVLVCNIMKDEGGLKVKVLWMARYIQNKYNHRKHYFIPEFEFRCNNIEHYIISDITHWMELPAAPEDK